MATVALQSPPKFKPRDTNTTKGSNDVIQNNSSKSSWELRKKSSLSNIIDPERRATVKAKLNAKKIRLSLMECIIGPEQAPLY